MRHLRIIFLLSLSFYAFIAHAQKSQTLEEFIEQHELQPYSPIASYKEETADLQIVFGEKTEGPDYLQLWAFFDQDGNQTELSYYNGSVETISSHSKNEYDEQGNQIQNAYYRYDGSLGSLTKYSYDEQDKQLEKLEYSPYGDLTFRTEFNYDDKGNLLEELSYGYSDTLYSKTEYKYDDKGTLIRKLYYGIDDYLSSKTEYGYDGFGNLSTTNFETYPPEPIVVPNTVESDETSISTTESTCSCPSVTTPLVTSPTVPYPAVSTGIQTPLVRDPPQFITGATLPLTQVQQIETIKTTFDENGNELQISRLTKLGDLVNEHIYEYDKHNNQVKESYNHQYTDLNYSIERVFDDYGNRTELLSYNSDGSLDYTIKCDYANFDKYNNWGKRTCIQYSEIFGEVQADYTGYSSEIMIREIFYHSFVE